MDQPALVDAAHWLVSATTGTVAVAIATIAVASVGFLMLTGRLPLRHGAVVIAGCFILFGAPAIAMGLIALVQAETGMDEPTITVVDAPGPFPQPTAPVASQAYDPYAGASVPVR